MCPLHVLHLSYLPTIATVALPKWSLWIGIAMPPSLSKAKNQEEICIDSAFSRTSLRLTSIKASHTTHGYPCFFLKRFPHRQLLPVLLVVTNALVTQQAVNQVLSRARRSSCRQGGESGEKRNQCTINWIGESYMFNQHKYHKIKLR